MSANILPLATVSSAPFHLTIAGSEVMAQMGELWTELRGPESEDRVELTLRFYGSDAREAVQALQRVFRDKPEIIRQLNRRFDLET